ncbi:hypothetical protein PORCRE_1766 [Porphyromonas crevioricanis JCM 15906]|uniref:Uncharacterized protein n=1 Tax=Porphyromonas crevioricanis JCM 15906 TaxID=1305617 RepID=T1CIQ2_9PORP|nr:hypothetical protein PORCRE_1766 [Porphyromonas crevioricanis JCM 15906]GAD07004.1 hypothetical protein PORCAN_617 [Porphyromonas crevioricanis JCM 13913]
MVVFKSHCYNGRKDKKNKSMAKVFESLNSPLEANYRPHFSTFKPHR